MASNGHTYSVCFAEGLEVDAVAFQRGKRRVPVAVVCLVGAGTLGVPLGGSRRVGGCLLRNLYASQEATVRTGHGTTD